MESSPVHDIVSESKSDWSPQMQKNPNGRPSAGEIRSITVENKQEERDWIKVSPQRREEMMSQSYSEVTGVIESQIGFCVMALDDQKAREFIDLFYKLD